MKKVSIRLLGLIFSTVLLFSCGTDPASDKDLSKNNDSIDVKIVDKNIQDTIKEDIKVKDTIENNDTIDFTKFEHYATILTKKDLISKFGKENLKDITEVYAEGSVEKSATILTNPQNGYVIEYIWKDDNNSTDWIEAYYNIYGENNEIIGTQKIKAENGLYLGMSLSELKEWNGDDFKFSGFGWDYAGDIFPQKDSKISKSPIEITLDLLSDNGNDFAMGDVELESNDSRLTNLDIIVNHFTMYVK